MTSTIKADRYESATTNGDLVLAPNGTGRIAINGKVLTTTSGTSNLVLGVNAGDSIESGGNYNVAIGDEAGTALTTGDNNVLIGYGAGDGFDAESDNVGVGYNALGGASYAASNNTAVGSGALGAATTGASNVAVGKDAGDALTTGAGNNVVGLDAGGALTTGNFNTAMGYQALLTEDGASYNTAIGTYALKVSNGGDSNTAVGYDALAANTTGGTNVGMGYDALGTNTTASNNVAFGSYAGRYVTTGGNNTMLGHACGDNVTTGTYNICIGHAADTSAIDSSFQIVLGTAIAGGENYQFTFGTTNSIVQNEFDTDAAWTRTSDRRKKRNIKEDKLGLDFINDLKTVTYQWRPSNEYPKEWAEYSEKSDVNTDAVMHGMIAQDIKEALDKAGCDTFSGWKERKDGSQVMSREMFVIPLIKAVQELSAEVAELKEWKAQHDG